MLSRGDGVLAGLSGGPDSVCLLVLLDRLRENFDINLYASYIEHGLRPDETPAEIDFCRQLCLSLNVPFSVKSVDVKSFAKAHRLNKQEAARELRYKALNEAAHTAGAAKIALGHTADDQAETVIMKGLQRLRHFGAFRHSTCKKEYNPTCHRHREKRNRTLS